MITEAQCGKLDTVWFVADDFRVIDYAVREAWLDAPSNGQRALLISCAYGKHHKQAKWIPADKLFATAAAAYRASAAMMRERAAALLAEADRRETGAVQRAGDYYARFIKAGTPAAT
jgi:hypothetical protein